MSFLRSLFGSPNVKELVERKDVPGLIKALGYKKDAQVRKSAAVALGRLGDPAAVEALIGRWDDDDPAVRRVSITAVVKIGRPAEEAVKKRLEDSNPRVRAHAAQVLKKLEPKQPPARQTVQVSKQAVRVSAASRGACAAGQPEPATGSGVDAFAAELGNTSYVARSSAIKELVRMGSTAVPRLIALLNESNRDVVRGAIQALDGIGDARTVQPLIELAAAKRDEAGLKWSGVPSDASEAVEHLGSQAVKPLLSLLEHNDPGVRREAASVLGKIGDPCAAAPLEKLLKDEDAGVREKAILALAETGGSEAVDPIVAVLQSDDEVRWRAAQALATIRDARSVDALIAALADSDHQVRSAVAASLRAFGDARAVDPLIDALEDGNADVRGAAASALGQIGDARAVQPLINALAKGSVRRGALGALAELGDARATPAIIALLEDEDDYTRADAARALGKLGDRRAVGPLISALRNQTWKKERLSVWSAYERVAEALGELSDPRARDVLEDVFTTHFADARAVELRAISARALVDVAGCEARERLTALANDGWERAAVRKAADEGLKRIAELPEPVTEEAKQPKQTAGIAATVSATLASLDAILEPSVGEGTAGEEEQAHIHSVQVRQHGEATDGFWIPEPSDAEIKLRIFLSRSLVPAPANYRVAANKVTDRGGYFLMFEQARAPGESAEQHQAAMDANRHLALGNLAAQRGDFPEALGHFQQAAKGQPYSPEAWSNAAVALASLNRNEEAIESCDQAIALKPGCADAWDIKGRCLGRLGRFSEAIPVIERYVELAPDDNVHAPRVRQAKRALQRLRSGS